MLGDYLRFLRMPLAVSAEGGVENGVVKRSASDSSAVQKPGPEDVLELIRNLDKALGSENYLPIFHLREKLQSQFSRHELDQILYQLQRNDQIELSSLQDVSAYSELQLAAGISQDIGGSLFFISLI